MVLFNYSTKELTAKVVYYGPGLCGKTTNLQWIHEKLPIKNKGKMLSLATETDRTLFFDFLPIELGTIRGMRTRIQLYTVPGQVFYNATRRMVLKGADCVVLRGRQPGGDARRQPRELREPAPEPRGERDRPRRDPDGAPVQQARPAERAADRDPERAPEPANAPFYEAVAVKGVGVEETLKGVTKLVFKSLAAKYGDGAPAPAAPGGPQGPPRSGPPPPPASSPPLPAANDDLLSELELGAPAPVEVPSFEVDGNTPVGSMHPAALRAALTPRPPAGKPTPNRQRLRRSQPPPARAPAAGHRPQTTLVTKHDEAAELRRTIGSPGMADEIEMDLEEIQELDHPTHGKLVSTRSTETAAPEPVLHPDAGTTEVEVPIDIEVAPGTTRVSLNIRLVLNLHKR